MEADATIINKVYTGRVIPTSGKPSGSAVIFDCAENHFQGEVVSPEDRINRENLFPLEQSIPPDEIRDRCAVSFSHQSPAKNSPMKNHVGKSWIDICRDAH